MNLKELYHTKCQEYSLECEAKKRRDQASQELEKQKDADRLKKLRDFIEKDIYIKLENSSNYFKNITIFDEHLPQLELKNNKEKFEIYIQVLKEFDIKYSVDDYQTHMSYFDGTTTYYKRKITILKD